MNQNICDMIMNLEQCAEYLYQERTEIGYARLMALLPEFESVLVGMQPQNQLLLMTQLKNALQAMEAEDNTLLADILQYELIEKLQTCV